MLMLEMFLMNVESLMFYLQHLWSEVKIFLLSGETLPVMLVSKVGCLSVTDYGNLYLAIREALMKKRQWVVMIHDCIDCDNHDHDVLWPELESFNPRCCISSTRQSVDLDWQRTLPL